MKSEGRDLDISGIGIVVLNYNGRDLTRRCLQSLLKALEDVKADIVVVDNASTDGSRELLAEEFPQIRVLAEPVNRSVTAYNDGLKAVKGDWVLLLNNDMLFEPGFIRPLCSFVQKHPDVFAVGSQLVDPDGRPEKCRNVCRWSHGWLATSTVPCNDPAASFFVGTHALFNRKKYLAVGGFDPVFFPFYSEDVDLCYRSWKRGWEVYVEPRSSIIHAHMGTVGRLFDRHYVLATAARNRFIMQWRNIDDRSMRLAHLFWLPVNIIGCVMIGKAYYVKALAEAWSVRREIGGFRRSEAYSRVCSDREILRRCSA